MYFLDNEELARDYEMKMIAKDVAYEQLQKDYNQEKIRFDEVKLKINDGNGYTLDNINIDELSSARQRIKALEEELEAQSKYSNNLITVNVLYKCSRHYRINEIIWRLKSLMD